MDGWKHRSIHWRIHLIDNGEGTAEARTWPSHWHFDRLSPESIDIFFFLSLSLFVRQHYFFFLNRDMSPTPRRGEDLVGLSCAGLRWEDQGDIEPELHFTSVQSSSGYSG